MTTCKLACCALSDETVAAIRASVEASRGKSMFDSDDSTHMDRFHRSQCRCGIARRHVSQGLSKHGVDDGVCPVHPGRPMPYIEGVKE
jgi:hypothetical protein